MVSLPGFPQLIGREDNYSVQALDTQHLKHHLGLASFKGSSRTSALQLKEFDASPERKKKKVTQ